MFSGVGRWSKWTDWTECTRSCGVGMQTQFRNCLSDQCTGSNRHVRLCNTKPCPGMHSNRPASETHQLVKNRSKMLVLHLVISPNLPTLLPSAYSATFNLVRVRNVCDISQFLCTKGPAKCVTKLFSCLNFKRAGFFKASERLIVDQFIEIQRPLRIGLIQVIKTHWFTLL